MAKPARARPVVRGALWLAAGVACGVAIGIADSRLRARRLVSSAPPIRPLPAPSVEAAPAQPRRRRRAARVALGVAGVLVLAALGAAIAFVSTRDERGASPTTAAVAGTATVRRTTTHAPARTATHATRGQRETTKQATTTGFVPARVFAWPVVAGADRYEIRFYRGPELILRERVQRPRFALPQALHLRPGHYRWVVLPHVRGAFGRAVVDSRFSVTG